MLYGAVLEEASWTESPWSPGSLDLAVFCLLGFFFFPLGAWGGRFRGGFCVVSLFSVCLDWLKSVMDS